MNPRNTLKIAGTTLTALLAAALLTACNSGTGNSGDGGDAGAPGNMTMNITAPAAGTPVTVPFTVTVDSSVPLGPMPSGQHHIHVWFDDNENDYVMIEASSGQVTKAPAGEHVLHVSLRNPNHSPAGVEKELKVMVTGGGAPGPTSTPTEDPYGY